MVVHNKRVGSLTVFTHILGVMMRVPGIAQVKRQSNHILVVTRADGLDGITVKAFEARVVLRLIQQFKTNHVLVRSHGVSQLDKDLDRSLLVRTRLEAVEEIHLAIALTTVRILVLSTGGTVKINQHTNVVRGRLLNGSINARPSTLVHLCEGRKLSALQNARVFRIAGKEVHIVDRKTNSANTMRSHPLPIAIIDEVVPVMLKDLLGIVRLHTTDNIELALLGVLSVLEHTASEPCLQSEPRTKVHTTLHTKLVHRAAVERLLERRNIRKLLRLLGATRSELVMDLLKNLAVRTQSVRWAW